MHPKVYSISPPQQAEMCLTEPSVENSVWNDAHALETNPGGHLLKFFLFFHKINK